MLMLRITSLIFALLVSWSACAQVPLTGAGKGAPGGGGPATVTYTGFATEAIGGPTANFTAAPIGAAAGNRVVAVAFGMRRSGTATAISSMTIGGIAAIQVTGAATAITGTMFSDIWYASVPTGTTANISVTTNGTFAASGIEVYAITTSTPAPAAGGNSISVLTTNSTTVTVPANGVGFTSASIQSAVAVTYTNATADGTNPDAISGGRGMSAAHINGTGLIAVGETIAGATGWCQSTATWGP